MRMLADNPSIDFLRREAKDLLGAMRESDENVTLADAQRAIAEMYGFRTWTDLKAEVDRRREALPEAPAGLADGVSDAEGAMAEPLAVALHAVNRAGALLGKSVLVTGCGPIGAMVVIAARRAGATHIVATDMVSHPLRKVG